jgi:hypothetical protein
MLPTGGWPVQATRENVLRVLRSEAAQGISFEMPHPPFDNFVGDFNPTTIVQSGTTIAHSGTISIDGSTFRRVADAIESGNLQLDLPPLNPPLPTAIAGAYFSYKSKHKLQIQSLRTIEDQAIVVHEAVHASLDLTRSGGIGKFYEEAAAYIADGLFSWARAPRTRYSTRQHQITIWSVIDEAVDCVRDRNPLPSSLVDRLATAVKNDPAYSHSRRDHGPYLNDG